MFTHMIDVSWFLFRFDFRTRVFKYVAKEIGEMYPTWDNDGVDVSVKNLVEFMFAKPE
ncbi:unnamed protein product [Brassica napus]|uniref:(rape) hypothetical protein n=1 Tax=Brassica napus TaxID=3708 RepID=A0A816X2W8_BRANA|nr:unnamed protein product [Brassica napus]